MLRLMGVSVHRESTDSLIKLFFLSETDEDPEDRNQPQQVNDELTKMKEELGKERHKLKARNEGKVYSC